MCSVTIESELYAVEQGSGHGVTPVTLLYYSPLGSRGTQGPARNQMVRARRKVSMMFEQRCERERGGSLSLSSSCWHHSWFWLRDFWQKEFKEVRYVGNDTFVVAYTLRL